MQNYCFLCLIDESTSLSLNLRCSVDAECEPITVFLDLLELSSLTADAIVESVMMFA